MPAAQPTSEADYWQRAIQLAEHGLGWTSPNPAVGAVLVKDGRVIGEGWHRRHGELHAEREALADAERRGNDPAGATIFVTLEPCAHTGSQPPCADGLIEAG
ncbi:MAG TPA: deaminase, partial [Solirubrobacterales bacterium]|nr:deaminase [Solirubrobacterales bacterium]